MELRYTVIILDSEAVKNFEYQENTVMENRIKTLIIKELRHYFEVNNANIHVVKTKGK